MERSSEYSDAGMFSGQKLPEKTMFNQTCSLLREYLKDNNGELNLGMALNGTGTSPETYRSAAAQTSNFFPAAVPAWNMAMAMPRNLKPMNFFHQKSGFGDSVVKDDLPKIANHCQNKPATTDRSKKAQMTIFYGGQVLVFNDFPAYKAKEIMDLASAVSSKNLGKTNDQDRSNVLPKSNMVINTPQEHILRKSPQAMALPIARKASLTRFLEKRKDRINARAAYETTGASAPPSKPMDGKSWLGLAAQSSNAV